MLALMDVWTMWLSRPNRYDEWTNPREKTSMYWLETIIVIDRSSTGTSMIVLSWSACPHESYTRACAPIVISTENRCRYLEPRQLFGTWLWRSRVFACSLSFLYSRSQKALRRSRVTVRHGRVVKATAEGKEKKSHLYPRARSWRTYMTITKRKIGEEFN